jgi:hypothetical protein
MYVGTQGMLITVSCWNAEGCVWLVLPTDYITVQLLYLMLDDSMAYMSLYSNMIINGEKIRIWKKSLITCFKALHCKSLGQMKRNHRLLDTTGFISRLHHSMRKVSCTWWLNQKQFSLSMVVLWMGQIHFNNCSQTGFYAGCFLISSNGKVFCSAIFLKRIGSGTHRVTQNSVGGFQEL